MQDRLMDDVHRNVIPAAEQELNRAARRRAAREAAHQEKLSDALDQVRRERDRRAKR